MDEALSPPFKIVRPETLNLPAIVEEAVEIRLVVVETPVTLRLDAVRSPEISPFPFTDKVIDGLDVPRPTKLFPPTQKAGVDVPESEITNAGVVVPISTERVPQGVLDAMPTAARPMPPEASEVEKTVRIGVE